MASIATSAKLPVTMETIIANIAPPRHGFNPPQGRMDLLVKYSDSNTLLADVTVTHPSPSLNQNITPAMLLNGHFAAHRETSNATQWTLCSSQREY